MPKAVDKQLMDFHNSWMEIAKLYQLRSLNDRLGSVLSVSQYYALAALVDRQGCLRMSEFAEELGLSFAGVNRMIEGLLRLEYVKKITSKSDSRVQEVRLTAKGRKHHAEIFSSFFNHLRGTLSEIREQDRAAVISGLQIMAKSLPKWRQSISHVTKESQ